MKVFVYYNLHMKCWSVKALSGDQKGRVVAHAKAVDLQDCQFRVSEAGRQRVLREKRKNVHAGVAGELIAFDGHKTKAGRAANESMPGWYTYLGPPHFYKNEVTYNPYLMRTFVLKGGHWDGVDLRCRAVSKADYVLLGYKRDVHVKGVYITNDMPHPLERRVE